MFLVSFLDTLIRVVFAREGSLDCFIRVVFAREVFQKSIERAIAGPLTTIYIYIYIYIYTCIYIYILVYGYMAIYNNTQRCYVI